MSENPAGSGDTTNGV
jgi:hypothetical protein